LRSRNTLAARSAALDLLNVCGMRVLHVVAPGETGGLERVVQLLAQGQATVGDDVHVAAVLDKPPGEHSLVAALRGTGITTHALVIEGRGYWRERAAMLHLVRRLRPEVVHTHGYRADLVDGRVARSVGAAAVTTVHGFTGGGARNRFYEWLQRLAFRRFDAVVAVSRPLADELSRSGVQSGRMHLVVNSWRPTGPRLERTAARKALGIQPAAFTLGWVGRLSHEKGLDVLIDAVAQLPALPIRVAVVGDGPERAALEARALRHGISDRITWHGIITDAARLYEAFDLFVLSSRTEGTPMVLFEAMAAGVPIVATSVGGVPDMLAGSEALLVPSQNPTALADAIRLSAQQLESTRERVDLARQRIGRQNAVEKWVGQYRDVYRAARDVRRVHA
jgi:glycosyltransferase involved in cell wall biosynthesis